MAKMVTYNCPDCKGTFDFLHHPSDDPPPSHCPLCGSDVSGKKTRKTKLQRAVTAPAIRGHVAKSVDGVYRSMETASATRAEEAARLLGVDPRSLSNMKMTNMKDNLREGDMSYMPSPATKIEGVAVDLTRPDTGKPLGAGFGNLPVNLPGAPSRELNNMMSSTFANHRKMVQATVASGKKN